MAEVKLDPEKVNTFLTHLARINNHSKEADKLRQELKSQIESLKKIPVEGPKRQKFDKEMQKLQEKIDQVIEIEKGLATEAKKERAASDRLEQKMTYMDAKISGYMSARDERLRRVEELEKRIKQKMAGDTEEIDIIEKHLMNMEDRYEALKKDKKHDEDDLIAMKRKIDSLKRVVKRIKK